MFKAPRNSGLSTIELLISMGILIIVLSGTVLLFSGSQSLVIDSQTSIEAVGKAEALIESQIALGRKDFDLVNPVPVSNDDIYQKWVEVEVSPDFFTKKTTSHITWTGDNGRSQKINLVTLISRWNTSGASTCNSVLLGDWKKPQATSYELGKDLLGDPSSGFPIGDIDINNKKLFIVVNNSNGNNLPTLFVFDTTNPISPTFVSSVDNNSNVKSGLNAIHVAGNYAYVANAHGANFSTCTNTSGTNQSCAQFQIFDISSNPPVLKYSMKIPGVTGSGGQAIGNSVFYTNGLIFLGLAKTSTGPEFNMIDVGGGPMGGSPTNPKYMAGYSVGNGINSIYVKGNLAYVASPNNEELKILDISNPLVGIPQVGGYNAPDNQGNGKSFSFVGDNIYFGRTVTSANPEFYILDNTTLLPSLPVLGSKEIGSSVNGIVVRDYLAFLLTNTQFQVWNIQNKNSIYPWTPNQLVSEFLALPGGSGTTIDCEGNYIYFASLPSNDKGYIAIVSPGP